MGSCETCGRNVNPVSECEECHGSFCRKCMEGSLCTDCFESEKFSASEEDVEGYFAHEAEENYRDYQEDIDEEDVRFASEYFPEEEL